MTPAERLIALLVEAPRLSLFVRNEVRFDKFDAYELVTGSGTTRCEFPAQPVVVNLDMPAVEENPEQVHWVDDIHRPPDPPG